jgi:hypothetical protein
MPANTQQFAQPQALQQHAVSHQMPIMKSQMPPIDMDPVTYQQQDPSMIQPQSARAQGQPITPYVADAMQPPSPGIQVHPVQQAPEMMPVGAAPQQSFMVMEQAQPA